MKLTHVNLFSAIFILATLSVVEIAYAQNPSPSPSPSPSQSQERLRLRKGNPGYPPYQGVGGVRGLSDVPTGDMLIPQADQSRGASCCIDFENRTGYYVDIWFDNQYQGRISPWQETFALCNPSGYKTFSAQTVGKSLQWTGNNECGGFVAFIPK